MARYKAIDTSPRFLAVDLEKQLLPGGFEYAVHHLLDYEIDLSGFAELHWNDQTGAAAYPPAMLLKVILCVYAQGVALLGGGGCSGAAAGIFSPAGSKMPLPRGWYNRGPFPAWILDR